MPNPDDWPPHRYRPAAALAAAAIVRAQAYPAHACREAQIAVFADRVKAANIRID